MKTVFGKLTEQTFIKPVVLSSIPYMTRKISVILRAFNTYIFLITEKNSSVCDTTVSTVNILGSIFGEHCVGPANLEYKVDGIATSMRPKLLDKLEKE